METDALPVAVIGLGAFGHQTLQALQQVQAVKVVGIADRNPATAAQVGRAHSVPSYSDNRSLLAEARPKAVYLAVPPMVAPELLGACAERGIHVWKELPLARDLGEGVAMVRRMEQAGVKFAVGTQRRFGGPYRRAWELRERIGRVFLGRAHYLFNWGPALGWRGDKASAGGGALLELGYHPIDLLVWLLGLPDEVYGISAGGKRPDQQRSDAQPLPPYDTDDTVAALLRYASGCMASVVTTRCSGPVSEELSLHGQEGSLTASSELCLLRNRDGAVLDRTGEDSAPLAVFRRQAEAFAQAVRTDARTYECSARENLLDLAVIEAIYLSDRTSQPETPHRLLKTHGLTAPECLVHRPPAASSPAAADAPIADSRK
jgi:predicted dehydrogenase